MTIQPGDRLIVTAGVVGWDAEERFPAGMTAQAEQAFRNIAAILAEASAGPHHIVRMTWYITSREAYLSEARAIGEAWRAVFGKLFPAMAGVEVTALMEADAMIEIEATAVPGA
ncbi:RidA family protein [Polymorphobacter multimanifer]|uniref:RidA family protein n=1 Tax=Polymorphobacter multimanifer TaxID=1070431 RepID=UPI001FB15E60|nr:RidA family protein [Polymorphobacter multimanifer]